MQSVAAPGVSARTVAGAHSHAAKQMHPIRVQAPFQRQSARSVVSSLPARRVACSATKDTRDVAVMRPSAPIPYTDRDPYALPREITAIQAQLRSLGWNKEWVEQITDRIMKKQLRTTPARTTEVIEFLQALGLQQDEICNMAFISIPLLGLSPTKQLKPVIDYLRERGVPDDTMANLIFKHPKLLEYRRTEDDAELSRPSTDFRARVRVDVVPLPDGAKAANVTYFRKGAAFTSAPISPWVPPTN